MDEAGVEEVDAGLARGSSAPEVAGEEAVVPSVSDMSLLGEDEVASMLVERSPAGDIDDDEAGLLDDGTSGADTGGGAEPCPIASSISGKPLSIETL